MLLTFFSIQRNAPLSSSPPPLLWALTGPPPSASYYSPSLSLARLLARSHIPHKGITFHWRRRIISSSLFFLILFPSSAPSLSSFSSLPLCCIFVSFFPFLPFLCFTHPAVPFSPKVSFLYFGSTLSLCFPPSHCDVGHCSGSSLLIIGVYSVVFGHFSALFSWRNNFFVHWKVWCLSFIFRSYIGIKFLFFFFRFLVLVIAFFLEILDLTTLR